MNSNIQQLGNILSNRMKATAKGFATVPIELGTVNKNLSITTDSLQTTIPKGDYMVNLALTGSGTISGGSHGGHESGSGTHSHDLPSAFRGLRAGDRILVAWCGYEPVVIAIVVSS